MPRSTKRVEPMSTGSGHSDLHRKQFIGRPLSGQSKQRLQQEIKEGNLRFDTGFGTEDKKRRVLTPGMQEREYRESLDSATKRFRKRFYAPSPFATCFRAVFPVVCQSCLGIAQDILFNAFRRLTVVVENGSQGEKVEVVERLVGRG